MRLLLIFLISLVFGLVESGIFRYRRSSILEAACKRKPFLGFCNEGSEGRRRIGPARPLPTRPTVPRPQPQPSPRPRQSPFPFGTERYGGRLGGGDFERMDRLEGNHGNSNWRKITGTNRPSTVSENLGLGGGAVNGGGGGGGIGIGSGVGVGVPGVGPIGVSSGLGIGAPGIGGNGGGGGGGLGLGNGGLFGISSGLGIGIPGVGPIGVSSGLGVGR